MDSLSPRRWIATPALALLIAASPQPGTATHVLEAAPRSGAGEAELRSAGAGFSSAAAPQGGALAAYRRARAVVERGVESMGGRAALIAAGGVSWEESGTLDKTAERQGASPDAASPGAFHESLAVDPGNERVAREYREDRYDGTWEWIREIFIGDDVSRTLVLQEGFAVDQRGGNVLVERQRIARRVPGILLEQLLGSPAALRHQGTDERGLALIDGILPEGSAVTVGLDPTSGVVRRLEYVIDMPTFGDASVTWEWSDYREVSGLGLFPGRRTTTIAGRTLVDVVVASVATGGAGVGPLFETPPDFGEPFIQEVDGSDPAPADAASGAELQTVAPGVHRVRSLRGGFHPLFVELDDFIVAVDAPAGYPLMGSIPAADVAPGPHSAWLSERYLQLIEQQAPGKPVRYVVITHFHNDHAGGVRAFVAAGATVVAAAPAAAALRQLVEQTPHTLAPDALTRSPQSLRLEVVEGSYTIGDGERVIEIIDVGPNPHTEAMLILDLPDAGIMFVSDLLDPTRVEDYPKPPHAPLDHWFGDWFASREYGQRRIYTMHGSGLITPEHLARLGAAAAR